MSIVRSSVSQDYEYLLSFLPDGWAQKAKELGALRRCRKIPDAETLLRIMFIHLAAGCSLRETAVQARLGKIADVSDVAILARLRQCGRWFQWMNEQLLAKWVPHRPSVLLGEGKRAVVVDATRIREPGQTGSTWTVLYAIELPSLHCSQFHVLDYHHGGETFRKLSVEKGDVLIGDRVYGSAPGISYVVQNGGDVLVRFGWNNLALWEGRGKRFDLLGHLARLKPREVGDWPVCLYHQGQRIPGRLCAVRKSRPAIEKELKRLKERAQRHGTQLQRETIEAAKYIAVFTTLSRKVLSPHAVLEFYRGRWQVELIFKRLKSIIGLSHLRKVDPRATYAWIQGKLLVSILIEVFLCYGESFFPWGYPICSPEAAQSQPLARRGFSCSVAPDGGTTTIELEGVSGDMADDIFRSPRAT